jgi:methylisocitrate lyase
MGRKWMDKASKFRHLLASRDIIVIPGTFNAIIGKIIEKIGFDAVYCSGAAICNSLLGLPDIGLISLTEITIMAGYVNNAVNIPVISDADTGFGNSINVMRTVGEFERMGIAGIHIEDQVFPKKCGHVKGKEIIDADEMVGKIKAAVAARKNSNFVIIARSDSKAVEGLEGLITRGKKYRDAGADIIFPEALETMDEFDAFARSVEDVYLMANMTEFGKTNYISVEDFKKVGFKIVIFPTSTMRIALKSIESFLVELREKGTQKDCLNRMQTRRELYDLLEYGKYTEWEKNFLLKGGIEPI